MLVSASVAAIGYLATSRRNPLRRGPTPRGSASSDGSSDGPAHQQQQAPRQQRGLRAGAMRSQSELVDYLVEQGIVKHEDVEAAMRGVDRRYFADGGFHTGYCYQDTPLPIGYGETISAPHMHATCLELLRGHLRPGARVLDVGSGSGYLSAAMGLMVRDKGGFVLGVEKHPELVEESLANVRHATPELLNTGAVQLRAGNVLGDVLEQEEDFDAIHVGAAAEHLPESLVRKLKPGGRMVIPVGPQWEYQVMQCIDKGADGVVKKHDLMYVRYVPLTEPGRT